MPSGATDPHEEEPELKIEQGLVHMDEPEPPAASSVFAELAGNRPFSDSRPPRLEPWPQQDLPRHVSQLSPGSGRSARVVRNLIGFALLASLLCLVRESSSTYWTMMVPMCPTSQCRTQRYG